MSDLQISAFVRKIIENPDDDTYRLVLADWLDERNSPGDVERAEFVRVQCRIAELEENDPIGMVCRICGLHTKWHGYMPRCGGQVCRLRRREYETSKRFCVWDWCRGIPAGSVNVYRRGFVEEITLNAADALMHLDAIRHCTPLRKVTLTTMPDVRHMGINKQRFIDLVRSGGDRQWQRRDDAPYQEDEDNVLWLLKRYFPGIAFTLPQTNTSITHR